MILNGNRSNGEDIYPYEPITKAQPLKPTEAPPSSGNKPTDELFPSTDDNSDTQNQDTVLFSGNNTTVGLFSSTDNGSAVLNQGIGQFNFLSTTANTATASAAASLANLESQLAALKQEITKAAAELKKVEAKLEELKKKVQDAEATLQREMETEAKLQSEYDALEARLEKRKEEYDAIIAQIEEIIGKQEESVKKAQNDAIYEALSEYDENKHGDFNEFFKEKLSGKMGNSVASLILDTLSTNSAAIARDLQDISGQLSAKDFQLSAAKASTKNAETALDTARNEVSSQEGIVNVSKEKVTGLQAKVQPLEQAISAEKAKSVTSTTGIGSRRNSPVAEGKVTTTDPMSLVSKEEASLVEKNNINLSEKLADGSPRYVFAPGKSDNKFHIYDMQTGSSLARLYGSDGNGLRGADIVPSGNGYLSNYNTTEEGQGNCVYYVECDGEAKQTQGCYTTSSPLAFDLNGDGVKTSQEMIWYDIDGNGTQNYINDSSDAVLVFDADGTGISGENGRGCFGDNTDLSRFGITEKFENGFEALMALAKLEGFEGDGKLSKEEMDILEEKYGFKIKLNGYNSEAVSVSSVIKEINLSAAEAQLKKNFDGMNNDIMTQEGATFTTIDGQQRDYADIWHALKDTLAPITETAKEVMSFIGSTAKDVAADISSTSENAHKALLEYITKTQEHIRELIESANQKD